MFELMKLLMGKHGFTCRVLLPGQVAAFPVAPGKRQVMVLIDLDD